MAVFLPKEGLSPRPSTGVGVSGVLRTSRPVASSRGPASPGAGASVPAITVAPREVLLGPVLRPLEKQKERLSGSK